MKPAIDSSDRYYIDRMRGISILRVVLMHLGLAWIFTPYSQLLIAFLPVLFFVSGAVSYFSFLNSTNIPVFLAKRLTTLLIPYYLITAPIAVLTLLIGQGPELNLQVFYQWLTLTPPRTLSFFGFAHIWFIHALLIITLISVPLFSLSKKSTTVITAALFISLMAPIAQTFGNIKPAFDHLGHNFFQPVAALGFYLLGALYYSHRDLFTTKINVSIALALAICTGFLVISLDLDINLANHSYSPNLYYILASFSAIFILLSLQTPISYLLANIRPLDWIIMIFCTNAYAIYIIHPAFITLSEVWFGLENVAESIPHAVIKIAFVLVGTVLIAIPVTRLTNQAGRIIKARVTAGK